MRTIDRLEEYAQRQGRVKLYHEMANYTNQRRSLCLSLGQADELKVIGMQEEEMKKFNKTLVATCICIIIVAYLRALLAK